MQRAVSYAEAIGARIVVPSAGPPCFVDPDLFDLNDFDRASDNIFPDQSVFLERADAAALNGQLTIAGTTFDVNDGTVDVTPAAPRRRDRTHLHPQARLSPAVPGRLGRLARQGTSELAARAAAARRAHQSVVGAAARPSPQHPPGHWPQAVAACR